MNPDQNGALDSDDDEIVSEVEITFNPRPEVLAEHGISVEDFEEALLTALEDREDLEESINLAEVDMPPLEEMPLEINGETYKLEDLAEIEIQEGEV